MTVDVTCHSEARRSRAVGIPCRESPPLVILRLAEESHNTQSAKKGVPKNALHVTTDIWR